MTPSDDLNVSQVPQMLDAGRVVVIKKPKGRSMLPFIRGGVDSVRLRKPEGLKVGDIALASIGTSYVVHRVIAIEGEKVTLMGDGNLQNTEHCDRTNVLGVVDEIITPEGSHRKPGKAWLWRHLLPIREYLLKIYRKWHKLMGTWPYPIS